MTDDIVTRLRETGGLDASLHNKAADEIERLRKERDEAEPLLAELWNRRTEATEMRDEIERLRKGGCARNQNTTQFCAEAVNLQAEVARLRAELKAWQDAHRSHPDEFGGVME